FAARWYGTFNFAAGTYRFSVGADDGARVAIDGNIIINRWSDTASFTVNSADVVLGAGNHQIIVDYYENTGNAGIQFYWTTTAGGGAPSVPSTGGATPTPTLPPSPGTL